jgi:hypothetical protein
MNVSPMSRLCIAIFVFLAAFMSGCQVAPQPAPSESATKPAPVLRATPTVTGRPATAVPAPSSRRPITLTVWLPDTLSPLGSPLTATLLSQQINTFAASQPDIRLQTLTKRAHGPGGILDLMQTAAPVAPSFLPDVALLDLAEVPVADSSGLLQPLNGLMPDDVLADLFPFAEVGHIEERWIAAAYAVDVEHVVYPSLRASPPITWGQLISGSLPYIFPAGAANGALQDALLMQYAAAGGRWLDASGQPMLEAVPLMQMLLQFKTAQLAGNLPLSVLTFNTADDTWAAYLNSPTQIAQVRASRFLTQRAEITGTLAAAPPGYTESARLVAQGWAFVIVARDPDRAAAAASLVKWLISAENEGALTHSVNLLPARRSAFDAVYPPDHYTTFLRRELDRAMPSLAEPVAQIIGPAIQKAVADVLRGQLQPAEAAMTAVSTVSRSK